MLMPILTGLLLGTLCMALHTVGTSWWLRYSAGRIAQRKNQGLHFHQVLVLMASGITFLTMLHVSEILLWALGYAWLADVPQLGDAEETVYFSFITFTTVGFGDVVIDKFWRLMAGIQALNGIMLLGWSTAVLMAMAQKIWQSSLRDGGTFSG